MFSVASLNGAVRAGGVSRSGRLLRCRVSGSTIGAIARAVALGMVVLPLSGFAADAVRVGDTVLNIPAPQGFHRVTPNMPELFAMHNALVPPGNVQHLTYIPEGDVAIVLMGEWPDRDRHAAVQSNRELATRLIGVRDFVGLKQIMRRDHAAIMAEVDQRLPGFADQANQYVMDEYGVEAALSYSQMVPLAPHEDGDQVLAFSIIMGMEALDETGNLAPYVGVVTTVMAHVADKLLYLYVSGEHDDLEWTRQVARNWTAAVLAANPAPQRGSAIDGWSEAVAAVDWDAVGVKATAAALLAFVIGLFGWWRK